MLKKERKKIKQVDLLKYKLANVTNFFSSPFLKTQSPCGEWRLGILTFTAIMPIHNLSDEIHETNTSCRLQRKVKIEGLISYLH